MHDPSSSGRTRERAFCFVRLDFFFSFHTKTHFQRRKPKRLRFERKQRFSHEAQHKNNFQSLFNRWEEKSWGSWQDDGGYSRFFFCCYFFLCLFSLCAFNRIIAKFYFTIVLCFDFRRQRATFHAPKTSFDWSARKRKKKSASDDDDTADVIRLTKHTTQVLCPNFSLSKSREEKLKN